MTHWRKPITAAAAALLLASAGGAAAQAAPLTQADPSNRQPGPHAERQPGQQHAQQAGQQPGQRVSSSATERAVVAIPSSDGVLVSWRMLPSDTKDSGSDTAFHVYRNGKRITDDPLRNATSFLDEKGGERSTYTVRVLRDGVRQATLDGVRPWQESFTDIPIDRPPAGTTPTGEDYEYRANDASVGDLDGDGAYEIVLKWQPDNAKDNSQSGYTGPTYIDAYEMDGTQLWRLDLGPNIRSGAHYSPFVVYDLDGDGAAEVALRTSDGTVDGEGAVIGDPNADHRNDEGYVLSGPEFLTVFDGETGAALQSSDYYPPRGDVCDWGDCYGNRSDRFLAGVAYVDGEQPSLVMARGYYTRMVVTAYDFRGGELSRRWAFDSNEAGEQYEGQGNHQFSVADVDGDGADEIIYGAVTIDDDGTALSNTGLGHGDALHVSDFDPSRDGMEVFAIHEGTDSDCGYEMHDPATGEVLWCKDGGVDTGRGTAGNIDPRHPGGEAWANGRVHNVDGEQIADSSPAANFVIWWDGDPLREILDHSDGVGTIGKWDWENQTTDELFRAEGTHSINGTKGNPSVQADLVGDWREEVIWPRDDQEALRMFSTPHETEHAFPALMEDRTYRLAVAWQNSGYNQPPHPSYFLGAK